MLKIRTEMLFKIRVLETCKVSCFEATPTKPFEVLYMNLPANVRGEDKQRLEIWG